MSSCVHAQPFAARDPDLRPHQVDAGHHLGDGVLDLDAGVHLEEVEVLVGADHELDRARADVADARGGLDRDLAHGAADLVVDERRRRFLDDLLVAALHRALALEDVDRVAVRVRQYLHLDVVRAEHELLDVEAVVAERRLGLGAHGAKRGRELVLARDHPHALAAAARGRLQHHGIADAVGLGRDGVVASSVSFEPGTTGTPAAIMRLRASTLSPIAVIAFGGGPMNVEAGLGAAARERGVLGEEAVPRMDRVGAARARRFEDVVDDEVALATSAPGRPDTRSRRPARGARRGRAPSRRRRSRSRARGRRA